MAPLGEQGWPQKRQREDDTNGGQRLNKAPTPTPSTKDSGSQKRNVSFSRKPMPGARTSSPGHRTNVSPQHSNIRPPTPQRFDLGRRGVIAEDGEVTERGAGRLPRGHSARSSRQNANNGRTIGDGPVGSHAKNNKNAGKSPNEDAAKAKSPGQGAARFKSPGKSAAKSKTSVVDNDPTKKKTSIYYQSPGKSPGKKNALVTDNTNNNENLDKGLHSTRPSIYHEDNGDGPADNESPFDDEDDNSVTEHIFDITERFHQAFSKIINIAALFTPTPDRQRRVSALDDLLASAANRESVAFASLICLGGPKGTDSWEEMLTDPDALQSLVVGLISYSVKTAIFDTPTFCLGTDDARVVSGIQKSNLNVFAKEEAIRKYCEPLSRTSFGTSSELLAMRIYKLVLPFYDLGRKTKRTNELPQLVLKHLLELVRTMAITQRMMLIIPRVVFEMTTAFKDFEFSPSHTECFNVAKMLETTPYTRPAQGGGGVRLKAGQEARQQSVVTILVSPGLVCYRPGGGSTAVRELECQKGGHSESFSKPEDGYRRQVLMKNVVWLQWGRQQMLSRYLGNQAAFLEDTRDGQKPDAHLPLWNIFVARHAETGMR